MLLAPALLFLFMGTSHRLRWGTFAFFILFFHCSRLVARIEANASDLPLSYRSSGELSTSITVDHLYRTAYHFQPARNWINDPNGPMYYNGIYHLFYQYNPNSALWGNISWGHSVSFDLINWIPLDLALDRTHSFDINGCWSGSVTLLPGNQPVILYTGINSENQQVQNIAFPRNTSDPFLREWIKPAYNPVMEPVNGLNPIQFRDPTTGWLGKDGQWRIAVGAELEGHGLALLYKSADFIHWVRAKDPLHSSRSSKVWECPDFYPVSLDSKQGLDTSDNSGNVKHVLKLSLQTTWRDYYLLGRYNEENDIFVPDDEVDDYRMWSGIDFGEFYASKSFYDGAKKRRILWAWSNESDSTADDIAKGWSGVQTAPRTIWLDVEGRQLLQWPIEEIESLRRDEVDLHDVDLRSGDILEIKGINSAQADVEVDFLLGNLEEAETLDPTWLLDPQKLCSEKGASVGGGIGPFGLLVLASDDLEEYTAVFLRVYKGQNGYKALMCSDQERSSLRAGLYKPMYGGFLNLDIEKERHISLRTLIDHSVIESFGGGGRACITARVYPENLLTASSHVYAFNRGTNTVKISKLKAWNMAKAQINIQEVAL